MTRDMDVQEKGRNGSKTTTFRRGPSEKSGGLRVESKKGHVGPV